MNRYLLTLASQPLRITSIYSNTDVGASDKLTFFDKALEHNAFVSAGNFKEVSQSTDDLQIPSTKSAIRLLIQRDPSTSRSMPIYIPYGR